MNNAISNGPFKDIIPLYINYKQSQGYKYEAGAYQLKRMDDFFEKCGYKKLELTEEMVHNYCKRKTESESSDSIYRRQELMKKFAIFLKDCGYKNVYVYNYDYIKVTSDFSQYIYSTNEIKNIFNYIDNNDVRNDLNMKDGNFNHNIRIIIRLLYCCGLRRNEALYLKLNDININDGLITIKDSKNYCSRVIPVSNTLNDILKKHIENLKLSDNDFIFKKSNNKVYDKHFSEKFKLILKKLNIYTEKGNNPRLHDLRFTFAVKALEKLQEEGQDLYCTLPILSVYMGHKNIKSTEYYLKYTKSTRDNINNKMKEFNSNIFIKAGN